MKKTLVFIAFIFFYTLNCFSQNKQKYNLSAGITNSSLRGNELIKDNDSRLDYLIGVGITYHLKNKLSLKGEVNYVRKKISSIRTVYNEFTHLISKTEEVTNFDYLSIPILLKFEFGNNNRLYINAGPSMSFLLNTHSEIISQEDNLNDNANIFDLAISAGLGKKFELDKTNSLTIEVRHSLGLLNTSRVYDLNNESVKTTTTNFILSWNFSL